MAEQQKRRSSSGLVVVLILIGITVLGFGAAVVGGYMMLNPTTRVDEGTALEIVLDGPYSDGPVAVPFDFGFGGGGKSLWDVRQALRKAASDDKISGVMLVVRNPQIGFGQRQELAAEIQRYREASKKPVHALVQTDMVDDGNYYLAAAASKVWVTPEAWWVVNGFQADVEFYRGTLDKLKIQPDVIMFKEYKSAGETFLNNEMSEPMREALTALLGDVYELWLDEVSAWRSMERPKLAEAVDRGTMTGEQALELGLADELGYIDQVMEALRVESGAEEYQRIGVGKYLGDKRHQKVSGDRVALVFGDGPIVSAPGDDNPFSMGGGAIYGPTVAKHLRDAADNDEVKAIVFRVNSPGGSAVGSDLIWREIERAQEKGKPVVVSMGSVAASGGYWVSMGSDAIVAESATITGSIGVVFTKFNIDGFYEMIGANVDSIALGENAGVFSSFQSFTEEQRETVVAMLDDTYGNFVQKVADGRGKSFDEIEPLAHGRVWTGKRAKDLGLIDEIGGIDRALALAAEKAEMGVEDEPTVEIYPKQKDFFEQLLEDGLNARQPTFDVEAFVREVGAPKVQALAPDIRIY